MDFYTDFVREYFAQLRQRLPGPLRVYVPHVSGQLAASFEFLEQGKTFWIVNRSRYAPYVRYKRRIDGQSRVIGTMRRTWQRVHQEAADKAIQEAGERYVEHLGDRLRNVPGVKVTTPARTFTITEIR